MAKPTRMTYSTAAIVTWVRAVMRIPATATASMTTDRPVAIAMSAAVLPVLLVNTASTEGPMTSTPATAPMT